jgi:predicted Ser/Thr protein kinase
MSSNEHVTATAVRPDDSGPSLSQGQVLANRYRLDRLLGRGGMGEVWLAYDLKLRIEVALKAMLRETLASDKARDFLRQEVRNARKVVSQSVCRVFDLLEANDRELVAMEYIDGVTLEQVLRERSPLELKEAQEIASQLLSGLEEIHRSELIHRDVKPSNIMVTRTGRVVVMDFGLARSSDESSGSVSGTPPYMAPEHLAGESIDGRADLFSAAVVLAEMVHPQGIRTKESRTALWEAIRHDPPRLTETPWSPVLRKALARTPAERYATTGELLRALENVTLRVADAEHLNPYPGLAAFTEKDAEFFWGREVESEQMSRKLQQPAHLHALIGPSGAGKSSFLRAGLIATAPPGWRIILATPGHRPFISLAQALLPEIRSDSGAIDALLRFEEPDVAVSLVSRWRRKHERVLVIVDQFEELFTLNPTDVQEHFATLLSRLALEADAHVLLSLRDDFFFHCQRYECLAPIFSEVTAFGPPTGTALRRALVQPALWCAYRFEDEALVNDILAEVEGERGALPLMAFAVSQLWRKRDRERGLLTRQAYEEIGGVAGALAQHAELTMDRIGAERIPIVRELFRNLVTAQGTRAARDRSELLSVFPDNERARVAEVLDMLVDARLLTSYELKDSV